MNAVRSWYLRRGRMGRSDYWLRYVLPMAAVLLVAVMVDKVAFGGTGQLVNVRAGATAAEAFRAGPLTAVCWLMLAVPYTSSAVTRLHDTGRPAWWLLVATFPVLGGLVLLFFFLQTSDPTPNRYGPPPGAQVNPAAPAPPQGGGPVGQPWGPAAPPVQGFPQTGGLPLGPEPGSTR